MKEPFEPAEESYQEYGLKLLAKHRKAMMKSLNRDIPYFWRKYKDYVQDAGEGRKRVFIDNGANILAVGHLDTVFNLRKSNFWFNRKVDKEGKAIVSMPTCDDRLGVASILNVLPEEFGMRYDILLTEGEETGNSTARGFDPGKQYNWIFELDRASSSLAGSWTDDAVLYQYADPDWKKVLKEAGFVRTGGGTVTDISYLQHLKAKAMNIAIGYHNYHARDAYFVVEQWARALLMLKHFYDLHKDTAFPHEPVERKTVTRYVGADYSYNRNDKWKAGMVVITKAWGTWDEKPKIGRLNSIMRHGIWILVDENNLVIDTPSSYEIVEQMPCMNCAKKIMGKFHTYMQCTWCDACFEIVARTPQDIVDLFVYKSGIYWTLDGPGVIESLEEGGALVTENGVVFVVDHEHLQEAMMVSSGVSVGSAVQFFHERHSKDDPVYFVEEIRDRDEVTVRHSGTDDYFIVPLHTLVPIGETNV